MLAYACLLSEVTLGGADRLVGWQNSGGGGGERNRILSCGYFPLELFLVATGHEEACLTRVRVAAGIRVWVPGFNGVRVILYWFCFYVSPVRSRI